MESIITDLHGNTYKLGDFKLSLEYPKFPNYKFGVYTRDIISNTIVIITSCTDGKVYMTKYLSYCKLFVVFELNHISYNEKYDIRKSYIHGNKYHA